MEEFINRMQSRILPIVTRISQWQHLAAIRQAMADVLPFIVPGAIALALNTIIDKLGFYGSTIYWIVQLNKLVFSVSVPLCSLFLVYLIGHHLGKLKDISPTRTGLVSLASFMLAITLPMTDGVEVPFDLFRFAMGSTGYFTAILTGLLASASFAYLTKKIKPLNLPSAIPPTIGKTLTDSLPIVVTLYGAAFLADLAYSLTARPLSALIYLFVQVPVLAFFQHIIVVALVAFFLQLIWFLGMHGGNLFSPIMEGIFGLALLANMEAVAFHKDIPYLWTNHSYGSYVWFATLGLLLAILLFSKKQSSKDVARFGLVPILFNIGESVVYGLPIVLNPIYFIPVVLCPAVLSSVAHLATSFHLVDPVSIHVSWITPPFLYGFIATGFDPRSLLLSAVNLLIATLIYLPFVKWADKSN